MHKLYLFIVVVSGYILLVKRCGSRRTFRPAACIVLACILQGNLKCMRVKWGQAYFNAHTRSAIDKYRLYFLTLYSIIIISQKFTCSNVPAQTYLLKRTCSKVHLLKRTCSKSTCSKVHLLKRTCSKVHLLKSLPAQMYLLKRTCSNVPAQTYLLKRTCSKFHLL